jgi:phosphoribosyl 1,2-cyclic phosphate phosphodiesterase
MGITAVKDAKAELMQRGCLAPDCRFIANHFSHNGGWLHEDLQMSLSPAEIEVGYDGLTVAVP